MIAHGYHIRPSSKDGVRLSGHQPVAGGVLPAHHGEVDPLLPAQGGQTAAEEVQSGLPHHVANG